MISHGNVAFILAQAAVMAQCDGLVANPNVSRTLKNVPVLQLICIQEPHTVTLAFLPFYHSFGLTVLCLRGFIVPQTFIILSKWDIDLVMELIPKSVPHRVYATITFHLHSQ